MTLSWIVAKILSASHAAVERAAVVQRRVRLRRALVHHVDLGDPRVAASGEADLVLRVLQVEVAADRDLLRRSVDHCRGFQVEVPRHVQRAPSRAPSSRTTCRRPSRGSSAGRRARRRRRRDDDRHDGGRRARDTARRRSGRVLDGAGRGDSPFLSPRRGDAADRRACRTTSRCRCRRSVVAGGCGSSVTSPGNAATPGSVVARLRTAIALFTPASASAYAFWPALLLFACRAPRS